MKKITAILVAFAFMVGVGFTGFAATQSKTGAKSTTTKSANLQSKKTAAPAMEKEPRPMAAPKKAKSTKKEAPAMKKAAPAKKTSAPAPAPKKESGDQKAPDTKK